MPEVITAADLDKDSRRRLNSLTKDNADRVARHLVYAGTMMDENPEVAYQHAQAAYRHAARVDIVREALGLAAYVTGRYAEALRELRTYRRMTDDYTHVAIEADSERGLGRAEKALSFIAEIPMKRLDSEAQIELALVTSGARADTGDSEGGLSVIEKIKAENLSEELQARVELIRADRYEELGRDEEAAELRAKWEPIFTEEGEVEVYEDEEDDDEFVQSSDAAEEVSPEEEETLGDDVDDSVDPIDSELEESGDSTDTQDIAPTDETSPEEPAEHDEAEAVEDEEEPASDTQTEE